MHNLLTHYVPHIVNGVPAEPPSFQYRRNSSGHLVQVPYVPPNLRGPAPPIQHPIRSPSPSVRSPPVLEQLTQGQFKPPEAAENLIAVPNASLHSPPRAQFGGIYGSPPSNQERPETPFDGFIRDGRWQSPLAKSHQTTESTPEAIKKKKKTFGSHFQNLAWSPTSASRRAINEHRNHQPPVPQSQPVDTEPPSKGE